MKIEVRPIEVSKWHGKSGKHSFSAPKVIKAFVNGLQRKYNTGLSVEDIKKLKGRGCKYNLSDSFDANEPHEFWDTKTAEIRLENNTVMFYSDNDLDFIKIKIMKASRFVANSLEEAENGACPDATHYIFSEGEEVEAVATRVEKKNKAGVVLNKLSKERKLQLALIITKKNLRGKSDAALVVEMDNIVTNYIEEFLDIAEKDKAMTQLEALVLEAILEGVLSESGHKIMYADSTLGTTAEEVALYLQEPENQELKITLMDRVKNLK